MNVLIVEDDLLTASALKELVELEPRYKVIGIAEDEATALRMADDAAASLALVDISLANNSSGYAVAAELQARGVPSIFITGGAPPFPTPELALGCLSKPFGANDLLEILRLSEATLVGEYSPKAPESLRINMYVPVSAH